MKRITLYLSIVFLVAACSADKNEQQLKGDFQAIKTKHQTRTWWRWLNGNVSKDGITKDLEAIRNKGMNGVTMFNLGRFYPQGDVTFMTDEWSELFDFSVDECKCLGLDFSFQMCDGWGASGGPWVPKEHAMKVLTSSKTTIKGGKKVSIGLSQPFTKLDFYKDIKVLAFPAIDTSKHIFNAENVKVSFGGWSVDPGNLIDGNRYTSANFGYKKDENPIIDFELKQAAVFSAINVFHGDRETPVGPAECELQYSTDDKNFKSVAEFTLDDIKGGAEFEAVKAKYFRLKVTKWTPRSGNGGWAFLSEVELLSPENVSKFPKINDFDNKASIWHRRRGLFAPQDIAENLIVKKGDIIDLTDKFNDGKLNWDVPQGYWTIARIGYTLTGRENGPATIEGTGLECDKLSKEAVELFYNGYAGKLLKRNKEHCGKTISRLFADSFEALAQNWTQNMQEEFEKRAGYPINNYLLVLSGEVVGNVEESEQFLYDFRKVLSEMLTDYYYGTLNGLCHKDNVQYVAQIAGEQQMLANPIQYAGEVDYPATEFWIDRQNGETQFRPNGSVFDAISASHIYNKSIIPTEAFTYKGSDFTITPALMKPIGDKAYSYGINQFEMHTYIHQPTDKLLGLQHYMFGISWGRKITWWDMAAGELTNYFARVQSILQKGQTVSDILIYTGEEIPNSVEFAHKVHDPYSLIPQGYKFDIINPDVLQNMVSVENEHYFLPNGLKYKVLLLPPSNRMSLNVLQKIEEFVKKGGIVVGTKPAKGYGIEGIKNENKIQGLANELWANDLGYPGKVYENVSIEAVMNKENIIPDFEYKTNKPAEILYIHKTIGEDEVYFLSNQVNEEVKIEALFRQNRKTPEIWLPEKRKACKQPIYTISENRMSMPLRFRPHEAKFVVFSKGEKIHISSIEREGQKLYPSTGNIEGTHFNLDENGNISFEQNGNYKLTYSDGETKQLNVQSIPESMELKPPFKVSFDEKWGSPVSIVFDELISWTEHDLDGIKYYSGTAVYFKEFTLSKEQCADNLKQLLKFDKVKEAAEIYVNGKKAGTIWTTDYCCDISNYVKEGKNTLEICVANTWNNRLAGDDLHPENKRYTYYPVKSYSPEKERRKYSETDMLESGIIGGVRIDFHNLCQ